MTYLYHFLNQLHYTILIHSSRILKSLWVGMDLRVQLGTVDKVLHRNLGVAINSASNYMCNLRLSLPLSIILI